MKRWKLLMLILVMGATGALAEEAEDNAEEEQAVAKVCVNKRNINSFDAIDDEHVYIKASVNDHYLFTMQRRCFGLRNAMGITLSTAGCQAGISANASSTIQSNCIPGTAPAASLSAGKV